MVPPAGQGLPRGAIPAISGCIPHVAAAAGDRTIIRPASCKTKQNLSMILILTCTIPNTTQLIGWLGHSGGFSNFKYHIVCHSESSTGFCFSIQYGDCSGIINNLMGKHQTIAIKINCPVTLMLHLATAGNDGLSCF